MAPLLGRKPYPLTKPLAEPPGPGDEVYIIEHTKEAFRNKEYPFKNVMLPSADAGTRRAGSSQVNSSTLLMFQEGNLSYGGQWFEV